MNSLKTLWKSACAAALALAVAAGTYAIAADEKKDAKPAAAAAAPSETPQLPPGWTEADMQAFIAAGTPGKMHEMLASEVGEWTAKSTMWMSPDAPPVETEGSASVKPLMDGRFTQVEHKGELPGMGPYHGMGVYGYDNVTQQFSSIWIDNHGTAMMNGTGELADGGKTINWKFTYTCPLTKKPTVMRQIEKRPDAETKTLEMWGVDPKSGKEFKMMFIELKRKAAAAAG